MLSITVDGRQLQVPEPKTVLEVSLGAGLYIPHLCYHPAIGPPKSLQPLPVIYQSDKKSDNDSGDEYAGCNLCLVEIEGVEGPVNSCRVLITDGMVIHTDTPAVKEMRKSNLARIVQQQGHPTKCILCGFSEGCDRVICSMNTDQVERCCWKYHNCEFREVASYIGLDEGLHFSQVHMDCTYDHKVLSIDYRFCIGCMRCVVACRDIAKRGALGFVHRGNHLMIGSVNPELEKSGCKFCLVCADVCPTGALKPKKSGARKSKMRMALPAPILPPSRENWMALNDQNLSEVPETEGVFRLRDEDKVIIQISGASDLKSELLKELRNSQTVLSFNYEVAPMFMMRERQIIQQHITKFGELPKKNREIDELF
ncbi:MAG: 2Fe-2S iron-sulfur cluster-binding protein [Negativicutes bacterium]|nr:2Fe-2S iron-sulfur cluster-binding protein [Negativicutes bacterium]